MASKNRGEREPWGSRRATTAPRGSRGRWAPSRLRETSPLLPPRSSGPDCQRAPSPATSHRPGAGPAPAMPWRAAPAHGFVAGAKTCVAPQAASHRANPVHVSRDSRTFVGALPEQPANAKRLSWTYSHTGTRSSSSLPHQPRRLSLPYSSFANPHLFCSSFPHSHVFLCCPPRHPLRYPTACPSTLFSKFTSQPSLLWDLLQSQDQESKWGITSLGALSLLQSLVLV